MPIVYWLQREERLEKLMHLETKIDMNDNLSNHLIKLFVIC